jgi:hypothetical protein
VSDLVVTSPIYVYLVGFPSYSFELNTYSPLPEQSALGAYFRNLNPQWSLRPLAAHLRPIPEPVPDLVNNAGFGLEKKQRLNMIKGLSWGIVRCPENGRLEDPAA